MKNKRANNKSKRHDKIAHKLKTANKDDTLNVT